MYQASNLNYLSTSTFLESVAVQLHSYPMPQKSGFFQSSGTSFQGLGTQPHPSLQHLLGGLGDPPKLWYSSAFLRILLFLVPIWPVLFKTNMNSFFFNFCHLKSFEIKHLIKKWSLLGRSLLASKFLQKILKVNYTHYFPHMISIASISTNSNVEFRSVLP